MVDVNCDAPGAYDEFGLFHENIAEFDLDVAELPTVVRIETPVPDGAGGTRIVSALRWGSAARGLSRRAGIVRSQTGWFAPCDEGSFRCTERGLDAKDDAAAQSVRLASHHWAVSRMPSSNGVVACHPKNSRDRATSS